MSRNDPPCRRLDNEPLAQYRARCANLRLAVERVRMLERWDHKREGTAETHEHASNVQQGAVARLYQDGYIDQEQLQWACDIASVAEAIQRDVAVKCSFFMMRVDHQGSAKNVLVEGVMRVRLEVAYGWWRERIPHPKRAILDMLIGEPQPYSTIARQYRMGKKRARKLLISAIDLWPDAMDHAEIHVDREEIDAAHARIA